MPLTDLAWRTRRPSEGFYTSELQGPNNRPVRTFLPISYEPNYPYPLLVFLHGNGSNEEQALKLAPKLSRRNYVAVSLRGPTRLERVNEVRPGFAWDADGDLETIVEDYVFDAVAQTRRQYHVHSERIFLVGLHEGASVAYRLALRHPEKFAGVVSLNGAMPGRGQGRPLFQLPAIRDLKIFIAHGTMNASVPVNMAHADYRAFYAAGLDVQMETYAATKKLQGQMLRDLDRWLMDRVAEECYC